ncbi:phosphoenolpyruvate synthase [Novosphingobium album (ex Liu et al. 2023)]|uniref:Phosphoenolpyruvate synthase n=1 Tax=Novosphingobium album (ex Liu et al. 2023) TaxID=3031130 RepID=A0ABT5WUZ7_9SPHN|nr:phosphoenolpyruvate synthase [Novosphingobium album (ex Liu et al. 2023)]MDE8653684.1 phosphoenolpyruvate synthase [Novosphingobium album (ex Liu et al. 2023)]
MASDIKWFETIGMHDLPAVGGKNASLGVLTRDLAGDGIRVPAGFALTTSAYRAFLAANRIEPAMRRQIHRLHAGKTGLERTGKAIREMILKGRMPEATVAEIRIAYGELGRRLDMRGPAVAVRSSATAEDLPGASFAGQLESFLNVRGADALIDACQRCFASLFTNRAIAYREAKGFDHFAVAVSVGVQRMVRSDRAGSGVIFTLDSESGFPDVVMISATWGLGETVVQGEVEPDRVMVFKPLLEQAGMRPIIARDCGAKAVKLIYAGGGERTRLIKTSPAQRRRLVLDDDDTLQLARWAVAVERHYGRPMDIEWAKDATSGELYLVQARPETVQAGKSRSNFVRYRLKARPEPILSGAAIGDAIAAGKACVIRSPADLARFPDGAILVTGNTDPDWVPVMKRAAGIVTDHGGSTSHAAIVSRELGVPAVVGTGRATALLSDGVSITLSCAEGEKGRVYPGKLAFTREEVELGKLPATRTQVMVNIADPATAFAWWQLPAKGVGLARMEFIIGNLVRVHPMALVHPERVSPAEQRTIRELARGHASPEDYFVDTLARGIARLATPWYPHPAIVRLSDFKTNEYARLIGGGAFEPAEENPMIGFRGASRYYDPRYREGFALECRALKRVREEMGFTNVIVMVPFCRTPGEADRVLAEMAANGLRRGDTTEGGKGLEVYMMCEIPANVVLAAEFAKRFDGFSIGSNDLTQLLLGVDRDSDILAGLFDERDAAVTTSISDAITRAHTAGIKVGICGQAPSNHPDFAAFLVSEGIDSISLNPDSFLKTVQSIAEAEAAMLRRAPATAET